MFGTKWVQRKIKNRRALLSIMAYLITACFIVLTANTFILYSLFSNRVINEIGDHSRKLITSTAKNTSNTMEWTMTYALKWSKDPIVFSAALKRQVADETYQNYVSWSQLRSIRDGNPFIESIYLINGYTDTIIDTRSGVSHKKNFYDQTVLEQIEQWNTSNQQILVPRALNTTISGKPFHGRFLSLIMPYEIGSSTSSFVVNIDIEELTNLIGSSLTEPYGEIYLVDGTGTIVGGSNKNNFLKNVSDFGIQNLMSAPSGWFVKKVNDSNQVVVYADTQFTSNKKWSIVVMFPEDQILNKVKSLRNWTILLYIIVLPLSFFLIWFFSKQIYRPIQKLMKEVVKQDWNQNEQQEQTQSEMTLLSNVFSEQRTQIKSLSYYWNNYKGAAKDSVLKELLTANSQRPLHQITTLFKDLKLQIIPDSLIMAIVRIDHYQTFITNYSEGDQHLFRFAINNIVEEHLRTKYQLEAVEMGGDHVVAIINLENNEIPESFYEDLQKCQQLVLHYLQIETSIAVSEYIESYLDLHDIYTRTYSLSDERFTRGYGQIILNEVHNELNTVDYTYPEEKERRMLNELKLSHPEETIQLLKEFMAEIRDYPYSESRLSLTHLMIKTGKTIQQLKMMTKPTMMWDIRMIEKTMNTLETADAVGLWLEQELIEVIQTMKTQHRSAKTVALVSQVKEMIEQQLIDPNLSAKLIADNLNMSINYIRPVFKEETGASISDYISEKRLENVTHLLITTDLIIEEIATKTGFPALNSFYVTFKKKFGITPAQYRREYKG